MVNKKVENLPDYQYSFIITLLGHILMVPDTRAQWPHADFENHRNDISGSSKSTF